MALKTYTPEELKQILDDHKKWSNDEGGSRANLSGVQDGRLDSRLRIRVPRR